MSAVRASSLFAARASLSRSEGAIFVFVATSEFDYTPPRKELAIRAETERLESDLFSQMSLYHLAARQLSGILLSGVKMRRGARRELERRIEFFENQAERFEKKFDAYAVRFAADSERFAALVEKKTCLLTGGVLQPVYDVEQEQGLRKLLPGDPGPGE